MNPDPTRLRLEFPIAATTVWLPAATPLPVARRGLDEVQRYLDARAAGSHPVWQARLRQLESVVARVTTRAQRHPSLSCIVQTLNDLDGTPGLVARGATLEVLDEQGLEAIERHMAEVRERLLNHLTRDGLEHAATLRGAFIPHTGGELAGSLQTAGIVVTGHADGVELAVWPFTAPEDIDRLCAVIGSVRRGTACPTAPVRWPVVCVDLNGVLDAYEGFKGEHHWDPPASGAQEFLRALHERGCRVIVFTTRHYSGASEWLRRHELMPFVDDVTDRKPAADVFVDDRAIGFDGDYEATLRRIDSFAAHWERR